MGMIRIYFGQVRRHSPNARLCLWREDYEDDLFGKIYRQCTRQFDCGFRRKAAVEIPLSQIGRTLEEIMFTRGEYDIELVASTPDGTNKPGVTAALRASRAF